jgi:hypothetical protein
MKCFLNIYNLANYNFTISIRDRDRIELAMEKCFPSFKCNEMLMFTVNTSTNMYTACACILSYTWELFDVSNQSDQLKLQMFCSNVV